MIFNLRPFNSLVPYLADAVKRTISGMPMVISIAACTSVLGQLPTDPRSLTPAAIASKPGPGPATERAFEKLSVQKIDPPSWWTSSSIPSVRVLLRGTGFRKGAYVECSNPKLQLTNFRTSDNGHYLFFDLQLAKDLPVGQYTFTVKTPDGAQDNFLFDIGAKRASERQPQGFGPDDAIYFVMPDRFADGNPKNNRTTKSPDIVDRAKPRHYHGGDLDGLTKRLDYVKSLGMTAIWTTPIYDNNDGLDEKEAYPNAQNVKEPSTSYHGYGAIDMYGVDEHLGDLLDLQRFVAEAHAKGLKVIQDQVANHTGPYHVWAEDPPTPTWWNGTVAKHSSNNWQKWTAMNPRATRQTQALNLDGWFIDILPDFNQDDPEVARYLIQNSIWWLQNVGFDAIRMDTLPHVPRTFWSEWASSIKREFPKTTILGELFDSDPALLAYYQSGRRGHDGVDTQIDTLFDFGLFGPVRNVFAKGNSIREIHQTFAKDWLYPNPNVLATFAGVHDMGRFMNEPGATERGLCLAFTLLMTSRGTPIVYYGDEIAMRGGADPDNRRDFPGGFPGDARNAFESTGRTDAENVVWNHLSKLGKIRSEWGELRRGASFDLVDTEQQYAYARVLDGHVAIVVFNNGKDEANISFEISDLVSEQLPEQQLIDQLSESETLWIQGNRASVKLQPRSAAIYRLR